MSWEECYFARSVYFILLTPGMSCALMVRSTSCACLTSFRKYPVAFTPTPETFQRTFLLLCVSSSSPLCLSLSQALPLPGLYFLVTPSFHQANDCHPSNPSRSSVCSRLGQVLLLYALKGFLWVFHFSSIYLCDYFMFNFPSGLKFHKNQTSWVWFGSTLFSLHLAPRLAHEGSQMCAG